MLSKMDDRDDIRSSISSVLPDLPGSILNIMEETLQSLGVGTIDDFQFVQEADLLCVLRPIQARKLVASWKQTSQGPGIQSQPDVNPSTSSSLLTSPTSSRSSLLPCPTPRIQLNADWVDRFEIPTERFPEALMQCLERGKRPVPSLRREMIRIVATEMMKACPSPTKHASTEVAKMLVGKYPQSLKDVIEGEVVGTGYHSLVKQLQARIDNKKRHATPRIKKRKSLSDNSDTDEVPAVMKASVQDTYGCVKWDMKFMPVTETLESQNEKKEKMKILWEQGTFNPDEVKELMESTYYSQHEATLFHYTEETNQAADVQVDCLPVTPCIIVCGATCYSASRFMLSIDGKIVNDNIAQFIAAINMMFGSYYCLNIHYPVELRSTLEFLQRCFFNINPMRGTKVVTKKNKKQLTVNPRVLTLIADLVDHEWRETN
ncbi:hypothetical protein MHYP_G00323760 [Metynnis hypsauchen]